MLHTGDRYARVLFAAVLLGALLLGVFASRAVASPDSIDHDDPAQKRADLSRARANANLSPDRLIVVYASSLPVDDQSRQRVRKQVNGQVLQASRELRRDVLRIPAAGAAAAAQVAHRLPGVRDAYPDAVAHVALAVNDPLFAKQWNLTTLGVPAAWDTAQGSGVSVGIVDCGIHTLHPDLAGKVTLEQNFTGLATGDDLCNHGTHVAGEIGADTNNGIGIAGIAPAAHLLNAKVLDDTGTGFFSDIDRGIQWAADNGAQVINLSLGSSIACPSSTQTAIDYAWSKGALIVAAAGNGGSTSGPTAPGDCQNVIAVAATDATDALPSWSNSGPGVQLAAPGDNILSTVNPDLNAGQLYVPMSGTSMSSAQASGVAALLFSTSFGSSPASVRDRLFATADNIAGTGTLWTYGRINAANAVAQQQTLTFDSLSSPNRVLSGRYPTGVIDWGSGPWWLSGPWGLFSGNSISFNGPAPTSASFTFLTSAHLVGLTAYNGGPTDSTITLQCSGSPTVSRVVSAGQLATLTTGWSQPCSVVTVQSSNGWATNFNDLVYSTTPSSTVSSPTPTPSSTSTSTSTPTSTSTSTSTSISTSTSTPTRTPSPTPSPTRTLTPAVTATPTPAVTATPTPAVTATPTPAPVQSAVTFDDLSSPNRVLTGQYPTGLINWGSGAWWLSSPWGLFTTNSISFNGAGPTSASFTFVTPHRLVRLDAYNGGIVSSTITLACGGDPNVTATLAGRQLATLSTGWSGTCNGVTITSSNGWDTNFDNLVVD